MITKIVITDEDGPAKERATVTITLAEDDDDGGTHLTCESNPAFPGPAADPSHKQTPAQGIAYFILNVLCEKGG